MTVYQMILLAVIIAQCVALYFWWRVFKRLNESLKRISDMHEPPTGP